MVGYFKVCLWQGWGRSLLFLQSLRIPKPSGLQILVYNQNNVYVNIFDYHQTENVKFQ